MEKELINYMVEHQIENNMADLKLLNIQLEFYNKLLGNAITKKEKEKYQQKIDDINNNINIKITDLINIL